MSYTDKLPENNFSTYAPVSLLSGCFFRAFGTRREAKAIILVVFEDKSGQETHQGVKVWLVSMVQLAPDWLVNNCVRNCVAASEDGSIQIAYFQEDRATGIEMNANGQLSPGITDLHTLRDTNSAPFARHKFMHMLTHSKSILDKMSANNVEEGLAIYKEWRKRAKQCGWADVGSS